MQTIEFTRYGSPDYLNFKELEMPAPGGHEVLVRIYATSINSWDWELMHAKPFVNRVMFGLFRPKKLKTLGFDIAGRVEAVGSAVKNLHVGDEVYGDLSACGWGGLAEYVAAPESALAIKPANLSFEQAAAVPQAGLLAYQGLVDIGHIRDGQKVLINGASGGSGSFAVQIAKTFDVELTGVCRTEKIDFVRSLGVDHVIDYTLEDFTHNGKQYDLIIDAHALHSMFDYRRALRPHGRYIVHGGATSTLMSILWLGPIFSLLGNRQLRILLHKANKGLDELGTLLESGAVVPIVDRIFPFSETVEAFKYYGDGNARGKVVVSVQEGEVRK